jgi:hypothetical protein
MNTNEHFPGVSSCAEKQIYIYIYIQLYCIVFLNYLSLAISIPLSLTFPFILGLRLSEPQSLRRVTSGTHISVLSYVVSANSDSLSLPLSTRARVRMH